MNSEAKDFVATVRPMFPAFAANLESRLRQDPLWLEQVAPGANDENIAEVERRVGVSLPDDYISLLRVAQGFWLNGGIIQFHSCPFFHEFPSLEELPPSSQADVMRRGGWPPSSQGMLCFAEFFMEADGDQVLFDVEAGRQGGEYPILYYAHDSYAPQTRQTCTLLPPIYGGVS